MKIGTRGSRLALLQTEQVEQGLHGVDVERVEVKTSGDSWDGDIAELGAQGAFVRELDVMVEEGELDAAVHSMKDMPTMRPEDVEVAAVLERETSYDALVTPEGGSIDDLDEGSVVGTSSARRRAQTLRYRGDVEVESLRGNVPTRVEKVRDGEYDAAVLSLAGLRRLELDAEWRMLPPADFVPSANQGAIAVVARDGSDAFEQLHRLDDKRTRVETTAERVVLDRVGGGCIVPLGVHSVLRGEEIEITAEVVTDEGQARVEEKYPVESYLEGAEDVADRLVDRGARELLEDGDGTTT